ncbi:MAG: ADP-ribosylglycohydrolase family protein [Myxococcaceae bacterium]|jgi:ADP-ribosylglycohydrolase|nr:ADP-ribosylglycohydrolase family protein [Myxococcaceae bacterium]
MPPPKKPLKKSKLPTEADENVRLERSRGSLLGLAVGEALGIPNEFKNLSAPDFPQVAEYPVMEPMGGGRFELKRGQTTWGTHLAVALSTVLRTRRRYELKQAAKAYQQWVPSAFDVPECFKPTAAQLEDGRPPEAIGLRVWLEGGQLARDNFALARTGVLGVFFQHPKHRQERLRATIDDTALTNFAPVCQIASATLNGVIAAAIMSPKPRLEPDDIVKVAEAELSLAASMLGRELPDWVVKVKDAADELREDLKAARDPDPLLYGPDLSLFRNATWVRLTFRLAFWELFHAPSFEVGVRDAANRGGDADTNAAVTGALLGAVFGEKAIPAEWAERVLEVLGPVSESTLWTVYHPRFLLNLAGCSPDDAPPEPEW